MGAASHSNGFILTGEEWKDTAVQEH